MKVALGASEANDASAYLPDGENLLPVMTGRVSPHARKLFWRYKAGGQRAVRDGDWKYLRITGNEFLFDVVKDPRERANLKDRNKDIFARLKNDWETWNETMLSERPQPAPYVQPGKWWLPFRSISKISKPFCKVVKIFLLSDCLQCSKEVPGWIRAG